MGRNERRSAVALAKCCTVGRRTSEKFKPRDDPIGPKPARNHNAGHTNQSQDRVSRCGRGSGVNRETDQAGRAVAGNGAVAMNVNGFRGGKGQDRCQAEHSHAALERRGAKFAILTHARQVRVTCQLGGNWERVNPFGSKPVPPVLRPLKSILIVTKQVRRCLLLIRPPCGLLVRF